jgi:2-polyprenyl-6-methoxyphenol hydroxylase-like FAD-dependent oxidoreductase
MSDYDVAVVGASIAGCTAATLLAREGARVALIESHSDPMSFKRMCTHAIQPSAGPTIERLGLAEAIAHSGAQPSDMNVWTRYGWVSFAHEWAEPPMSRYPIWNIRRETLDPMLRDLATGTDGVEPMLGRTAVSLLSAGDGGRVEGVRVRERDGAEHDLRARLVVAADGRNSQIAKLANQPTKLKPHNRFFYFGYYRDTPAVTGAGSQLWLLDPDVAYSFPTDGGLTLLACMIHKDRLPEYKDDPESAMARLFEGLADAPRLDPAKRESKLMGKLDMQNVVRRPWAPGVAFVGDAALAADPLWGVGCGWALQSAEWLSDAVGPVLRGGAAEIDGALGAYGRRHRKSLGMHERLCSDYSTGKKFNALQKLLYRGGARDRQIAQGVALIGGRWMPPLQVLSPRMLLRMARVNASRGLAPVGLRTPDPAGL